MKVVLKTTVFDRIIDKVRDAHHANREVDYIVLTPKEYDELREDRRSLDSLMYGFNSFQLDISPKATIETRDFPLVDLSNPSLVRNRPCIRAASRETFQGAKLYVVPEEYCPR